ncbi:nitroreductase [Coprothermobacteraceae bacterium]|nr:nitroreductase [Coprothermobacteraceae bacterium]
MRIEELEEIIKTRRSIRYWEERDVPDEVLRKAIELACYAPSGMNYQGWKFKVIKNKGLIGQIADAVRHRVQMMVSWPESKEHITEPSRAVERSDFFRKAPVLIAVYSQQYPSTRDEILQKRMQHDPEAVKMKHWSEVANSRIQSVAAAIAYLLLALHAQGVGAVWMTGPVQAKEEIENLIGKHPGYDVVALIAAGYPAETPSPKKVKAVEEVAEFLY